MKLTYGDNVLVYEFRNQEKLDELSNKFGIIVYKHRYILKLINRYEIESIKKGKNH